MSRYKGASNQPANHVSRAKGASEEYSLNPPFAKQSIKATPKQQTINQQAFKSAVQEEMPMSPEQIHRFKQLYHASKYAASAQAGTPPKPVATSIFARLSPGSTPPSIRLSQGFVTSMVFLDSTGAPWPIQAYDLGNPEAFNIAWDKKDNVLMIQSKDLYTYGNLAVRLKGLNTPVMLTLIPGQTVVDYRADVTVPGYGPEAKKLPMQSGVPDEPSPILLKILDGVPPEDSKKLKVSKGAGEAWLKGGKVYLRTHHTLLSPSWLATMSSADGTKAYELQQSPRLLISKHGKLIHVKLGGF
jgi:intracellular multiplication protein IcmK